MKRLLYLFTLLLLLSSCNKSRDVEPVDPTPATTPQTTLIYFTGTDLSSFFSQNISAAKSAIAGNALGYGRFVAFRHTSSTSGNLIEYKYDGSLCVADTLKSYTSVKSLSQETITTVIADLKELAPADSYNLIVSGHATAWVPQEHLSSTWRSPSAQGSINWEAMTESEIVTRYLGSKNDGYFDIDEFEASLTASNTHFGYILFDECFMSSIEALYALRNNSDYIIASPCEIMGAGFPYDTVLPALFSDSGSSFDLQKVCQAYLDYYSAYSIPSACVALTVTAELEPLADVIRQINSVTGDIDVDTDQLQVYERLMDHLFFDLEDYMLAKCGDNQELKESLLAQMQRTFPEECRLHTERFFANIGVSASSANNYEEYFTSIDHYSGVSTSAPSLQFRSEWESTDWAKATN